MNQLSRSAMAGVAAGISVVVIALLAFALPAISERAGVIILDRQSEDFPFTIQNLMIVLFMVGLGELFLRWQDAVLERSYTRKNYLPEDDRTMLQSHDLAAIRPKVLRDLQDKACYLPNMINRCILQFQASRSVDQTNSILTAMADIYSHQIDLKYSILRYISWSIPTIGFIGTVVGIANALNVIGANPEDVDMAALTANLGVAFNTTLVALVLSAILVFFIHVIQEKEEMSLNKAMQYCLNNLINRLYSPE